MKTKYGDIPDIAVEGYNQKLLGKVYKLLPIREKSIETLPDYHFRLMNELIGGEKISPAFRESPYFVSLIFSLEGLMEVEDFLKYRGIVLGCMDIVKKINSSLDVD